MISRDFQQTKDINISS